MSSIFDSSLANLNSSHLTYWGESISYTMVGGEAATVTAAVNRSRLERVTDEDDERGTVEKLRMPIKVQTSEVTTRTPGKDSVVIDSATWSVVEETGVSGGFSMLIVERDPVKEYSAPGHRRRRG